MHIVFMGTPDFAVPSLKMLIEEGYTITGVVTQPDKPKGRGHKLQFPPVKEVALAHQIPVYQPEKSLKDGWFDEVIRGLAPDVIVVAAYGRILPLSLLQIPRLGCVNVHGSLLPKYRGAAPIQWSVLNGDKITGITTMMMAEGLDTGDMLLKEETPIGENESAGELFERLSLLGAKVLKDTLAKMKDGTIQAVPQNEAEATYVSMLSKEMAILDWHKSAFTLHKLVCGLNPWPIAQTTLEGQKLKVYRTLLGEEHTSGVPGTVIKHEKGKGLLVQTGEGTLWMQEIQAEGKKRMTMDDYLCGHPIPVGTIFGEAQ